MTASSNDLVSLDSRVYPVPAPSHGKIRSPPNAPHRTHGESWKSDWGGGGGGGERETARAPPAAASRTRLSPRLALRRRLSGVSPATFPGSPPRLHAVLASRVGVDCRCRRSPRQLASSPPSRATSASASPPPPSHARLPPPAPPPSPRLLRHLGAPPPPSRLFRCNVLRRGHPASHLYLARHPASSAPLSVVLGLCRPSDKWKQGVVAFNSSDKKRYRDRERYLNLTSDQREDYLERNREYKRLKKDDTANCSNAQTKSDGSKPNITRSIQVKLDEPFEGNTNSSVDSAASSKRKREALWKQDGHSFIQVSAIGSEDQAAKDEPRNMEQHKHCRRSNWYSKLTKKFNEANSSCTTDMPQDRSNIHNQSTLLHQQEHTNNGDDAIYLPNSMPHIYDDIELPDIMTEYDIEDEESLIFSCQGSKFESYQDCLYF
ncbi:hypothetical protein ACP4OV_016569 [Aristida adscensionis]